jgi:DNA-binding PadR family transcriptional regulator
MKRPLNYALLKYFTTVDEASVDDVMAALEPEYAHHRAFSRPQMFEALMTAEKNCLIGESRFDLDSQGNVRIYYRASDEQKRTIDSYIK